jgi:serine/threonine protein phosphatase 1
MFLKRLFRPIEAAPLSRPAIPDGRRVYAIGDIHGRLDLLDRLLAMIGDDDAARGEAETTIIFLGDLIDRGPESRSVVARALELSRADRDIRFVMGNHEETLLALLNGHEGAVRLFLRVGGEETLASYGVDAAELIDADAAAVIALAQRHVPEEHVGFIAAFKDAVAIGGYLFVHAGLRPGVPLAEQRATDMRWIRDPFLDHAGDHGHFVVHGHTITPAVDERPNRIGIDTGAYYSDRLTAIGLQGTDRWLLDTAPDETREA